MVYHSVHKWISSIGCSIRKCITYKWSVYIACIQREKSTRLRVGYAIADVEKINKQIKEKKKTSLDGKILRGLDFPSFLLLKKKARQRKIVEQRQIQIPISFYLKKVGNS